jgi:cytochrome c553
MCQGAGGGFGGGFGGGNGFGGGTGFGGGAGGACGGPVVPFMEPSVMTVYRPAPISGGTVVVVDESNVVVVDADREVLWTVDVANQVSTRVALASGSRPGRAVVDASGQVHVVLRGTHSVAHLDPRSHALTGVDVLACPEPRGLDVQPTTQELVVACQGGEVLRFLPGQAQSVTRLGTDLRDVLVDETPQGERLTVTTFRRAELVVSTAGAGPAVTSRAPPGPDREPEVAWRTVKTSYGPLMVHQQASTALITTSSGGMCPAGGTNAYGSSGSSSSGTGSDAAGFAGIPDACLGSVVGSALFLATDLGPVSVPISDVLPVDVAVRPIDLVCHGSLCSKALYVAVAGAGGSASVYRVDPDALRGQPATCLRAIFSQPGSFTGVAFTQNGRLVLHERETSTVQLVDLEALQTTMAPPTVFRFAGDSVDSDGSRLFHRAPSGGAAITCASCHPEGGEDGHTWLLNGEARRTQSLQGGVTARAPFHWRGDLPTLDSLMSDTFVQRMGGGQPPPSVVDTLGRWLDTVPAPRASSTATPEQLTRGRAAFEKAGCAGCHLGPQLSNHLVVSVGTGGLLKTPSLVGLSARGPWMHNGCATTLRQRFSDPACGGTMHGNPSALSAGELDDLLAYLESL